MPRITVQGKHYDIPEGAQDVSIRDGQVRVKGQLVVGSLSGIVEIKWEGPAVFVECDGSITVSGDVQGNVLAGGSVACGAVGGKVNAGGSVACGAVAGKVLAGGRITMTGK